LADRALLLTAFVDKHSAADLRDADFRRGSCAPLRNRTGSAGGPAHHAPEIRAEFFVCEHMWIGSACNGSAADALAAKDAEIASLREYITQPDHEAINALRAAQALEADNTRLKALLDEASAVLRIASGHIADGPNGDEAVDNIYTFLTKLEPDV
jgi:hypothetical protein